MAAFHPLKSALRRIFQTPRINHPGRTRRLWVEPLESREVPTVTLIDIPDQGIFFDRPLFIPLTPSNVPTGAVTYTASGTNPDVEVSLLPSGPTWKIEVTGKDNTGTDFSGTMTVRLFSDFAPLSAGQIISNSLNGFYDGKVFHRIIDNFMIQGGSPNGDGIGGSALADVADEFNTDFTFASSGILAMANARDDNNNSQFFITDLDQGITARPNYLNFNHTVVGVLTSGFDIYQKIITTPVVGSSPVNPVTITKASVTVDEKNALLMVKPLAGFTAGSTTITVTADDTDGTPPAVETFTLTGTAFTGNDRAFLGRIDPLVTAEETQVQFTVPFTNREAGDTITVKVGSIGATPNLNDINGTPANATVTIDPVTRVVTVKPNVGFTGDLELLVGVWDGKNRGGGSETAEYDTQRVVVSVTEGVPTTTALAASKSTVGVGRGVLLTATVAGPAGGAKGSIDFFDGATLLGSATVVNGKSMLLVNPSVVGTTAYTASFVPANATDHLPSQSGTVNVTVTAGTPPKVVNAVGSASGFAPLVTATDENGDPLFSVQPFEAAFTGGVRVAVADVTGDGQDDVVVTPGFGGAPIIKVYDVAGTQVFSLMVFEDTFRGGLYVDTGDALGKGYSQILVGAGITGGPRVTLFDVVQNKSVFNFFAYDQSLRGGVTVDMTGLRGGGQTQFITGAGVGGGPVVAVWNGYQDPVADGQTPVQFGQFFGGPSTNLDGIRTGEGALKPNGRRDILVGPQSPDASSLSLTFDPYALGIFVD